MKTFSIKIPRGIRNHEKIRLLGQGKKGQNGGKNGDLLININILDDKNYKLKGYDLYTNLNLTPWEAALGTKTSIKTIDDETSIYIPKGIQSGEKLVISNKGYKSDNKENRGNLIVKVKIVVPKDLTNEEKQIYKKLSEISKFNPRK